MLLCQAVGPLSWAVLDAPRALAGVVGWPLGTRLCPASSLRSRGAPSPCGALAVVIVFIAKHPRYKKLVRKSHLDYCEVFPCRAPSNLKLSSRKTGNCYGPRYVFEVTNNLRILMSDLQILKFRF